MRLILVPRKTVKYRFIHDYLFGVCLPRIVVPGEKRNTMHFVNHFSQGPT